MTVVARLMVTDPAVPPMTTAASEPDGDVSVEMLVPATVSVDTRLALTTPPTTGFVTVELPVASHVPSIATNVTVVVGEGAVTETATGTPMEPAVGSVAGAEIWNATDAPDTV